MGRLIGEGIAPRAIRCARSFAFDQLHDERADAAGFFEAVDRRDVRMIERREELRFALEARQPVGVLREAFGQHLEGAGGPPVNNPSLFSFFLRRISSNFRQQGGALRLIASSPARAAAARRRS